MKNPNSVPVYLSTPPPNEPTHLMTTRQAAKDIALGSFAGMVAATLEYPFDLAKVRLQSQLLFETNSAPLRFNGPWDCLVKTWKYEGVRGLYRGLPIPVVGAMAETAALFLSYSYFQNLIRSISNTEKNSPLSIPQLGLAAGGAGFVTSFVLTPIELVKCRMQVQMMNMSNYIDSPSARNLSTSAAVSKSTLIFSARAVVNGLGAAPETGGSSIWFSVKEWTATWLQQRRRRDSAHSRVPRNGKEDLLPWESALAGALAGAVSTLLLAVQTEGEFRAWSDWRYIPWPLMKRMYATNGLKGFYTGCGMTIARAVPGSAIIFLVYDGLSGWLG
ncbi:mitochondrial carrier [Amanita rubescens]|nr:mitochondrial carrier [Amanita rubescens]